MTDVDARLTAALAGRYRLVHELGQGGMDFGVAKAVAESTGAHQLTSIGIALGTPAYMRRAGTLISRRRHAIPDPTNPGVLP